MDIAATVETGIVPTNRWYREALADAALYAVEPGLEVLAITPLYFVATKLEAFRDRGNGDFQASHDLEDVLTVIAGLETVRSEIETVAKAWDGRRVAVSWSSRARKHSSTPFLATSRVTPRGRRGPTRSFPGSVAYG